MKPLPLLYALVGRPVGHVQCRACGLVMVNQGGGITNHARWHEARGEARYLPEARGMARFEWAWIRKPAAVA